MSWFADNLSALAHQFFPSLCLNCREALHDPLAICCIACQANWGITDLHKFTENSFTRRFWGRTPLVQGAAMFHFLKEGTTQKIIHALKYQGKQFIGTRLGRSYGHMLKSSWTKDLPDCIVPVPLHPKRKHERGYNQAVCFGRGLSMSMGIPLISGGLSRLQYMSSQTNMNRSERFQNVLQSFSVNKNKISPCTHVLLVDDVLTTGATLEACAIQLMKIEKMRISMATIAMSQI
ncbi:MAG: ComF family protein [Saprospiraceae bacterium]|nr:ComF family protein [Saprospiraceae bacterium]